MPQVNTLRRALAIWTLAAIAAACLVFARVIEARAHEAGASWRWLALIASVATTLPLMVLACVLVRGADEYWRHLLTTGAALAFAGMLVLYPAFYAAQEAGLAPETAFLPYLPTGCALWCIGSGIAWLAFRARR